MVQIQIRKITYVDNNGFVTHCVTERFLIWRCKNSFQQGSFCDTIYITLVKLKLKADNTSWVNTVNIVSTIVCQDCQFQASRIFCPVPFDQLSYIGRRGSCKTSFNYDYWVRYWHHNYSRTGERRGSCKMSCNVWDMVLAPLLSKIWKAAMVM